MKSISFLLACSLMSGCHNWTVIKGDPWYRAQVLEGKTVKVVHQSGWTEILKVKSVTGTTITGKKYDGKMTSVNLATVRIAKVGIPAPKKTVYLIASMALAITSIVLVVNGISKLTDIDLGQ